MHRSASGIIALVSCFLLVACDLGTRQAVEEPTGTKATSAKKESGPAEPNWTELRRRVKDADAQEKAILDLMQSALDDFKESKKASGAEAKRLLTSAKNKKLEAGGLYDVLEDEARKVHKDLFKKSSAFRDFQTRWDRFARDKEFATIQKR